MRSSANLSPDRVYRYSLMRVWDESLPLLVVIALNPSRADETENDPTIEKEIKYAKRWGCGGLLKLNLFFLPNGLPERTESREARRQGHHRPRREHL
jgi:hypothetical protein